MMENNLHKRILKLKAFISEIDGSKFTILDTDGTSEFLVSGMNEDFIVKTEKMNGTNGDYIFNPKKLTVKELFIGFHDGE